MVTTTATSSIATIAEKARITQIFEQGFFAIVILLAVWTHAWSADGAGTVKTLAGSATSLQTATIDIRGTAFIVDVDTE